MDKDYYYELKYVNDDCEVVMKFNASIDADSLRENLGDFLKACSWDSKVVDGYILAEDVVCPTLDELNVHPGCTNCGGCK